MNTELRELVRQIPPWAEEDYLPRLSNLRWAVQSIQVLQVNANAQSERLNEAADAYANQLSTQPDGSSTNIAAILMIQQQDAATRFAAFRRDSAINDAKMQLDLKPTTDGLGTWQRLAEWTNDPTVGSNALELREQIHSRLLDDEIAQFCGATKVGLGKIGTVTNNDLRQAGYLRTLERVTVQRLHLLEENGVPPTAVNALADLSALVEGQIKRESEMQKQEDEKRIHGYQQWALQQISAFHSAFNTALQRRKPGAVYGTNPDPDYEGAAAAMVRYLIPISPSHLDSAVGMIYRQAFDEGMNKLENDKYYQTDVANKDAITSKKTPLNYLEN
jgi:hypothetical protein